MSTPTISEILFEQLCSQRGVGCTRIPEGPQKTADYRVAQGSLTLVAEVKQLDPNNEDKKLATIWGTPSSPGTVAPSDRVQGLLDEGYPQVKHSCEAKWPFDDSCVQQLWTVELDRYIHHLESDVWISWLRARAAERPDSHRCPARISRREKSHEGYFPIP